MLGRSRRKGCLGRLLNEANSLHFTKDMVASVFVGEFVSFLNIVTAWAWGFVSLTFLGVGEACLTCIDESSWRTLLLVCSLKINQSWLETKMILTSDC